MESQEDKVNLIFDPKSIKEWSLSLKDFDGEVEIQRAEDGKVLVIIASLNSFEETDYTGAVINRGEGLKSVTFYRGKAQFSNVKVTTPVYETNQAKGGMMKLQLNGMTISLEIG